MMIHSRRGFLERVWAEWYDLVSPLSPSFLGVSPPRRPGERTKNVLGLDLAFDPFNTMVGLDEPNGARA